MRAIRFIFVLFSAWIFLGPSSGAAQNLERFEALFIIRFIDNIGWTKADKTISIGVLGNSRVLVELNNKIESQNLNLSVERVRLIDEVLKYDVIFIAKGQETDLIQTLVRKVAGNSILLVSEDRRFAEMGADISFFVLEDKLKFIVNNRAVSRKNIQLSSHLIGFAAEVIE